MLIEAALHRGNLCNATPSAEKYVLKRNPNDGGAGGLAPITQGIKTGQNDLNASFEIVYCYYR